MRSALLVCIFILQGSVVVGQYVPGNGQAFQFAAITNPAFTGVENFGDLKLSYRHQWSGFGSYSPSYVNLSYNTRLKHPVDLRQNSMRMSKPSLMEPRNLPRRKRIIHGLGMNVFHSEVGVVNSLGGALGYAFNYPLSKKFRFSLGVSSLVESRQVRLDGLTFNEPDPYYKHLLSSPSSQLNTSLRAGVLLYSKGFYLGGSYMSLANKVIKASEMALDESFYRASVQTGFAFRTNPAVVFKPSVLMFLLADNSFVIDYSLKAYLEDKGWAGMTYRDTGTGILMLGLDVSASMSAAYSYEVGFGGFQPFGGSSHELVVGFRINNLKKEGAWTW